MQFDATQFDATEFDATHLVAAENTRRGPNRPSLHPRRYPPHAGS